MHLLNQNPKMLMADTFVIWRREGGVEESLPLLHLKYILTSLSYIGACAIVITLLGLFPDPWKDLWNEGHNLW